MTILTLHDYLIAFWQTLYTVLVSSSVAIIIGLLLGCLIHHLENKKTLGFKGFYWLLDIIVNLGRSTPFIILLIALIPITRWIVGTSIGVNAALVPLTIAAIPFYARVTQSALHELPKSILLYAQSLGISAAKTYRFIFLPEVRVALIQGATLTIINLIGYSAITGVVGGGGIGQLAIDYGYQRFNVTVILITVLILFLLVQAIQWLGNLISRRLNIKTPVFVFFATALLSLFIYNFPWQQQKHVTRIGVMSGFPADIFKQLEPVAEKKYGIAYKVVTFDDYSEPNRALNDGDIDINDFQHVPFFDADVKSHGYHLTAAIKTFAYPIAFYSKKINSLSELKPGSIVAISSDASNQGRALRLLAAKHLITLKPGVGLLANIHDITSNPLQLKFITLASAALPRALQDADLVAINNDFLKDVHLKASDALLKESGKNNPYTNIAAVRTSELHAAKWQKWKAFLHSKEMTKAMDKYYPDGEAVPGW